MRSASRLLAALAVPAMAWALPGVEPDPAVSRLAGLARAWGQVKYVHPAMAGGEIDWDAALVRAIPSVEAARSDAEYRRAVAGLLAELRDPATRVVEPEAAAAPPEPRPERSGPRLERIDEGTALVVVPTDPPHVVFADLVQEVCARFGEAAAFDRVVLDLRGVSGQGAGGLVPTAIYKCLGHLFAEDLVLPPARFLEHEFYWFQNMTGGAGGGPGGSSRLAVSSWGVLRGEGRRTPRLAVIVNAGTGDVYAALMALQARGVGRVIQQGPLRDAGLLVKTFEVDPALTISIRHGELVRGDGGTGFVSDEVVGIAAAGAPDPARTAAVRAVRGSRPRVPRGPGAVSVRFRHSAFIEDDYSTTPYPDRAHRLLALFRLWNVIEYFYPYKDLLDRPWSDTLAEFLPRLRDARDETGYVLAVAELATRIQDSHVTVHSPVLDAYFGTHRPAARVDLVEGRTTVTEVSPELGTEVRVGDVVVSVDGEDAATRRTRLARYLPASTAGRLDNKVDIQFLMGPPARPALVEVQGEDGRVRRAALPRTLEGPAPRARPRTGPAYAVLPQGPGYVDLERLRAADVAAAFEGVRNGPGLILDMRGYPGGAAFAFVDRLGRGSVPPAARVGMPRYDGSSGEFSIEQQLDDPTPAPGPGYAGRVVVLADGSSQSAAEYVCMLVKAATPATFVGSRTSGANGGVTRTVLPGGIAVNFTGYSLRHPDGRQLQRVGILPDVEVRPTLRGIREGRDEVLERAVEVLRAP